MIKSWDEQRLAEQVGVVAAGIRGSIAGASSRASMLMLNYRSL